MTVSVWRIAVEAPAYSANDLTGTGAKTTGGRWNSVGTPVVYCASNIALAALETLISLRAGDLPFNRFLVRIDIPAEVWATREVLRPLPGGWDAIPSGLTSRKVGDDWQTGNRSLLLLVPSVIVPDEYNVLINPLHSQVAKIKVSTVRRWDYDPRFF